MDQPRNSTDRRSLRKPPNWEDRLLAELEEAYKRSHIQDFWPAEKDAIVNAILAIAASLGSERYTPKRVLGVGGSGIVLQVHDANFPHQDSALKFPRPVQGKVALVAELLEKEATQLGRLRHPGIVRILDYGRCDNVNTYDTLPFYLMETVQGLPSGQYIQKNLESSADLVALLRSASETVHYLHTSSGAPIAHLDIKPDNFMVNHRSKPVMIDLGTCKILTPDADHTTVACTRSFAHPELVRHLQSDPTDANRAKGALSRSNIKLQWDLWSLALTSLSWMGFDPGSGHIEVERTIRILDSYTRKYLLLLAARILAEHIPSWLAERVGLDTYFIRSVAIDSSAELNELLGRLDGTANLLATIPELETRGTGTIQAAPGTQVAVTPALEEVLKHRLFRRLNTISQLGLVSQVYPGAKHTRREHSLGTYANTIRMIKVLYNDPGTPLFKQIITRQDCRDVLLASLLHDIGHFPLAHDLEEISDKVFSHTELTQAMLRGAWDKRKRGAAKVTFPDLREAFESWESSADSVIEILTATPQNSSASPRQKLLRSLISGPIDADKLDYLFRDARHLDLPYPNGVDIDRLLSCLTTVVIDKIEGGYKNIPAIGVHAKGKVAAEFLSMARYAMFSQAYWHHAVRVQKAMLLRAVAALLAKNDNNNPARREFQSAFVSMACSLPESLYAGSSPSRSLFPDMGEEAQQPRVRTLDHGTDLAATDAAVLSWFLDQLHRTNMPEAVLVEGILRRALFKRLWVVSRDMEESRWDKIIKLWKDLSQSQRSAAAYQFEVTTAERLARQGIERVTTMASETARDRVDRLTKGRVPWLLVDIPGERPGSDVGLYYVLESQRRSLRRDDRAVGDLQRSAVWEQYARDLLPATGKVRIFCQPQLVDSIEASVAWEDGIGDLISVLEQITS